MVTPAGAEGIRRDVRDVCKLAGLLLGPNEAPATSGAIGLLASDFAHAPSSVTIDELLQVQ